ncbi:MAG: c-type cytochrome [Amaricoccus sp.]
MHWLPPLLALLAALAAPARADQALISYGRELVDRTYRFIGPEVPDRAMRYAGNNLACQDCHLDGGRLSHGLALVGVSAKYPKALPGGGTETLAERINGCMERSMNGRPLPVDSREMRAFLAYLDMLTRDAGSFGDPRELPKPLSPPTMPPDPARGRQLFLDACAACHRADGSGMRNGQPGDALGYLHPPLWGADSFNAAAGMSRVVTAGAFIHDNMPPGTDAAAPALTAQDAWDIAAYLDSRPRPPGR